MKFCFAGMRRWLLSFLLVLGACAVVSSAQGAERIITELTAAEIVEIMKDEGYSVELESYADQEPDVLWQLDGNTCIIFTYDDGHAIQFYVGFTDTNATLRDVNEWNKTKRFSRSYLDDEGDPCLELDLDFAGGITESRLHDFFRTCKVSFQQWHKYVVLD